MVPVLRPRVRTDSGFAPEVLGGGSITVAQRMVMFKGIVLRIVHEMDSVAGVVQNFVVVDRVTCVGTYNSEAIVAAALDFVVGSGRIVDIRPSHAEPMVVKDFVVGDRGVGSYPHTDTHRVLVDRIVNDRGLRDSEQIDADVKVQADLVVPDTQLAVTRRGSNIDAVVIIVNKGVMNGDVTYEGASPPKNACIIYLVEPRDLEAGYFDVVGATSYVDAVRQAPTRPIHDGRISFTLQFEVMVIRLDGNRLPIGSFMNRDGVAGICGVDGCLNCGIILRNAPLGGSCGYRNCRGC